jgi:hypothetical protein
VNSNDKPKDLAKVPRPVAPAPRKSLIDLRNAPSSMEQAAERWAGRGR